MSVCASCHAGCCRRYYIDLTGSDIIRISNALELDIPLFVQALEVDNNDIEEISKDAALFKFKDNDEKYYYRFCLKRTASPLDSENERCMFLLEWNGNTLKQKNLQNIIGRCGIYGIRPLVCAIYPAKFDKSGMFGFIPDPHTSCEKKKSPLMNLCPRPAEKDDYQPFKEDMMKNLLLHKAELEFFKGFASYWNSNPGYMKDFFPQLKSTYKNRIMSEAEISEQ